MTKGDMIPFYRKMRFIRYTMILLRVKMITQYLIKAYNGVKNINISRTVTKFGLNCGTNAILYHELDLKIKSTVYNS